jgi:hypothetical protein
MSTFVRAKNGFVNGAVTNADVSAAKEVIRAFLNSTTQDYAQKTNPIIYQEVLRAARCLIGENFQDFLEANYKNGIGPLASIVGSIVLYLNNKCSARAIGSDIRCAEEIVHHNNNTTGAWERRFITSTQSSARNSMALTDNITNFDYYRLLRGIGMENMSRILLALLGETRYDN